MLIIGSLLWMLPILVAEGRSMDEILAKEVSNKQRIGKIKLQEIWIPDTRA